MSGDRRLQSSLASWQDWDVAAYELAVALGILAPDTPFATDAKHVVWSNNYLGDALSDMLSVLVRIGALEFDEEGQKYRWRAGFDWRIAAAPDIV